MFGVDFSGGLASVVSQLNAQFGGTLQFSNPSGTTLQVLDDGGAHHHDERPVGHQDGDGARQRQPRGCRCSPTASSPFTDAITANGAQTLGFAGRIAVNPALLGDPTKLTLFGPTTANGDPTRPNFIYNQLTSASFAFSAQHRPRQRGHALHRQRAGLSAAGAQHAGRSGGERIEPVRRARTWWSTRSSSA